MSRIKKIFPLLLMSVLFIVGCSAEEEFESFSLEYIGVVNAEDTETPRLYIVNPETAENQVIIIRNEVVDATTSSSAVEEFELDNVIVTDEEIVIEYEGEVETFERLSETVVRDEDNVQYQYKDESVK